MKKSKKPRAGEKIVSSLVFSGQSPGNSVITLYPLGQKDLARRIDSAIARRDRRAINIVNKRLGPNTRAAKDIVELIRSGK